VNALLVQCEPGDPLAMARIDTGRISEKDIVT
jgi:hypothetical protein